MASLVAKMIGYKKTPIRIQIDPIECGAVALGIILEYYGSFVPSGKLRDLANVSTSGGSAKSIIDAATALGLSAKAHKILASEIKKIPNPSILFVDQCHFVVFEGFFLGKFYINDPAFGRYTLTREQFRKRFSRVAINFEPVGKWEKERRPISGLDLKLMFLSLGIFSATLFAMFAAFLGLLSGRGHELYLSLPFMLGGFSIIFGLALCLKIIFLKVLYGKARAKEAEDLEKSLHKVRPDFFSNLPFMAFQKAYLALDNGQNETKIAKIYFIWPFIATMLTVVAIISPIIFLVLFLFGLLLWPFTITKQIAPKRFDLKRSLSMGIDLKAMGQEDYLLQGLMKPFITCSKKSLFYLLAFWLLGLIWALTYFFSRAWLFDDLSLSEIFSLEILIFLALSALVFLKSEQSDHELLALKREISFAAWKTSAKNPKKPQMLAVVAKHQAYSLLSFTNDDWRVALIDEDSELFDATLKDNLSLFAQEKDSDLMKALSLAEATELFYNRPLGLLTPILASGKNLSHSEKKRLLLAQALVKKPDILLLDDFFSALDEKLALKILKNLKSLKIPTVFTSFRHQELLLADEVSFLEQNIVSKHEDLEKNPDYQKLINY